ncbi:MAG: Uma2 family endonuclease [Byssovorax sp.]
MKLALRCDHVTRGEKGSGRDGRSPGYPGEIVSPSSEGNDVVKKMRTYRRCGVPHYWIIDPIAETLIVYRWTESGYLLVQAAQGSERVSAKPFDAVSFSVHGLLEGDDE